MKKPLLLFILSFTISALSAQTWKWAKMGPQGDPVAGHIVAADDSGNVYFTNGKPSLIKFDNSGSQLWYQQTSGTSTPDYCQAVAVEKGFAYVTGQFSGGSLIFGTDTLSTLDWDVFVAKYNSGGTLQWVKQANANKGGASGQAIAADLKGNVYVAGIFADTVIFGPDTLRSIPQQMFMAKYSSNGNILWGKAPKHGGANAYSVTTDNLGYIYVTGIASDTLVWGNDTLILDNITGKIFLMKCDSNGNAIWIIGAKSLVGEGSSEGMFVSVDGHGNSYVGGNYWNGTLYLGPYTFNPSYSGTTPFITRFDKNGKIKWACVGIGIDSNSWQAGGIAADTLKDIFYMVDGADFHKLSYSILFGTDTLNYKVSGIARNYVDALIQFDSSGNILCHDLFNEGAENDGDGMDASHSGQYVYVAGDLEDNGIFGPDTLKYSFGIPSFIACWQPCNTNTEGKYELSSSNSGLILYPNPNIGQFTIGLSRVTGQTSVEIYNMLGERIYSARLTASNTQIEFSNSSPGIYLYRVITETGNLVSEGKFIIQK